METPQMVSLVLGILVLIGTLAGAWLARRGKREDNRLAERAQTFQEVVDLSAERLVEINRLTAALAARDLALEKIRTDAEARWDRQMARCRKVTDSLAAVVSEIRKAPASVDPDPVLLELERHNQDDHGG